MISPLSINSISISIHNTLLFWFACLLCCRDEYWNTHVSVFFVLMFNIFCLNVTQLNSSKQSGSLHVAKSHPRPGFAAWRHFWICFWGYRLCSRRPNVFRVFFFRRPGHSCCSGSFRHSYCCSSPATGCRDQPIRPRADQPQPKRTRRPTRSAIQTTTQKQSQHFRCPSAIACGSRLHANDTQLSPLNPLPPVEAYCPRPTPTLPFKQHTLLVRRRIRSHIRWIWVDARSVPIGSKRGSPRCGRIPRNRHRRNDRQEPAMVSRFCVLFNCFKRQNVFF